MYKALILSHGHFVISAGGGGLVFKTTHEVEDSAYEVVDSVPGIEACFFIGNSFYLHHIYLFA